jgi:signal transduction histidine kinase
VGLIGIHRDITELRRNEEMVRDSREQMRNLAASLMAVREEERSAISRELHDELGQALTRLRMELRWISEQPASALTTDRAGSLLPLVGRMLDTVRHISSRLRPPILDDLGLEAAIEWQVQEFARWSDCRCRANLRMGDLEPHPVRDTAVFRIVQEALTNVARHAQARQVLVRAWTTDGEVMVEIADDGIGVPQQDLSSPRSLGLIGMRERADSVGGQLHIVAMPPTGTTIRLCVPIGSSERSHDSNSHRGRPPHRARRPETRRRSVSRHPGRRRSAGR